MQDSMMIAEVGDMPKVSGRRMATPLAAPSPGRTPIRTPSVMPMNMYMMFIGTSTISKPCISDQNESKSILPESRRAPFGSPRRSVSQISIPGRLIAEPCFQGALGERHQEPDLEGEEERESDRGGDGDRDQAPIAAEPDHEDGDEDRAGDVDADIDDEDRIDRRRHQNLQDPPERAAIDESSILGGAVDDALADQGHRAGDEHQDANVEREITRLRPVGPPRRAQLEIAHHHDRRE